MRMDPEEWLIHFLLKSMILTGAATKKIQTEQEMKELLPTALLRQMNGIEM